MVSQVTKVSLRAGGSKFYPFNFFYKLIVNAFISLYLGYISFYKVYLLLLDHETKKFFWQPVMEHGRAGPRNLLFKFKGE